MLAHEPSAIPSITGPIARSHYRLCLTYQGPGANGLMGAFSVAALIFTSPRRASGELVPYLGLCLRGRQSNGVVYISDIAMVVTKKKICS